MTSGGDIYRAAHLVMQIHGPKALDHARQRERDLLLAGDEQGAALWRGVLTAVVTLQAVKPDTDEMVQ